MTHRVVYSPRSRRDSERIRNYIATESGSDTVANHFLIRLFDACDGLSEFPSRFPIYPYARHWKMMPFGQYLVFFQIAETEVRIGHIRHAARKPFTR